MQMVVAYCQKFRFTAASMWKFYFYGQYIEPKYATMKNVCQIYGCQSIFKEEPVLKIL